MNDAWIGKVIAGRYRVCALLGRGGMAEVYQVENVGTGQLLALKMLAPPSEGASVSPAEWASRFKREAQAASLLDHPHIVEVLDLGVVAGTLFYVMELVNGTSLEDAIVDRTIGPRRALILARQMLDALAYAHERGIVHRDLKPSNIMVVRAGTPGSEYDHLKLVDFGLVKLIGDLAGELGQEQLTRTGLIFGTPDYMAPEQALGRPIDGRADLYSVGVTLFEMLTGLPPFVAEHPRDVLRMHVTMKAPTLRSVAGDRPFCTPEVEAVVERALRKQPDERFTTATEMGEAVERAFVSIAHLPREA